MSYTVNRMVLDLSHHNTIESWSAIVSAGIAGIIHKASEGDYNTDDTYTERRSAALANGLEWGAYHFGTNDQVGAQVDLFLEAAKPDADTLICLDWEPYGDKTMSTEQAREWIAEVEERLGRPGECVIYSGNLAKEELGNEVDEFFGSRRLWLAHYSSDPSVQASWDEFWLWQYSDGVAGPDPHGCPGVSGAVDTNSYDGSKGQLVAQWASGESGLEPARPSEPAPEPEPEATETITITITVKAPAGVKIAVNTG